MLKLKSLSSFNRLLEESALNEALGALSALKAGELLNVFKQTGWASKNAGGTHADGNKFNPTWGGGIGQNSEQENIGKINSWKDIRKVTKKGNGSYMGFVLYVNGVAFATVALNGNDLSSINDSILVAYDASKLPKEVVEAYNKEYNDYRSPTGKSVRNDLVDKSTKKAEADWHGTPTGKIKTGVATNVRDLERYVDETINACIPFGYSVTCTMIKRDTEAAEVSKERRDTQSDNDVLAKRDRQAKGEEGGYGEKKKDLMTTLDKFKASKNTNSFTTKEELATFVTNPSNYGKPFVYSGRQYSYEIKTYDLTDIKVNKKDLIFGKPLEFSFNCPCTDKGGYESLRLSFSLTGNKLELTKVGY